MARKRKGSDGDFLGWEPTRTEPPPKRDGYQRSKGILSAEGGNGHRSHQQPSRSLTYQPASTILRYIDDVFLVWHGSESELLNMVDTLNQLEGTIRFTAKHSRTHIEYLDVAVSVKNSLLEYTLFRKTTDRNTLLHYNSFHPQSLKDSIPVAQFSRVIRNNSNSEKCEVQLCEMKLRFLQRGYPPKILDQAMVKARGKVTKDPIPKTCEIGKSFVCSTNYTLLGTDIRKSLVANWRILRADPALKSKLPEKPTVGFKRSRNLRDILVKTDPIQSYRPTQTWLQDNF
ncbi:hypothetical protein GDO86_012868 [Hymenochirus boettgeri]|uniref:Helix-turn-helix domain-containing protein n=1 Tax=Hymenochirus boettgeri TaxID=247094 RepID=A0A8T2IWZ4_9PIPI|nr:hypothetical protein GDO86_012868 [Hymenochirus boettgeri]